MVRLSDFGRLARGALHPPVPQALPGGQLAQLPAAPRPFDPAPPGCVSIVVVSMSHDPMKVALILTLSSLCHHGCPCRRAAAGGVGPQRPQWGQQRAQLLGHAHGTVRLQGSVPAVDGRTRPRRLPLPRTA